MTHTDKIRRCAEEIADRAVSYNRDHRMEQAAEIIARHFPQLEIAGRMSDGDLDAHLGELDYSHDGKMLLKELRRARASELALATENATLKSRVAELEDIGNVTEQEVNAIQKACDQHTDIMDLPTAQELFRSWRRLRSRIDAAMAIPAIVSVDANWDIQGYGRGDVNAMRDRFRAALEGGDDGQGPSCARKAQASSDEAGD